MVPASVAAPSTPDERASLNTFMEIVTNVRRDKQEGIVMPLDYDDAGNKMYDFTLMSSGGKRTFDTSKIVDRYDTRIAQSVLADFIMLGTKNVGSFALASNKTALFSVAIGSYLDTIQDVFNSYAIPRLFLLNPEFRVTDMPKLAHGDIETTDLTALSGYMKTLSDIGVTLFPDESLETYLFDVANLPKSREKTTNTVKKEVIWPDDNDDDRPGLKTSAKTDKEILAELRQMPDQVAAILADSGML